MGGAEEDRRVERERRGEMDRVEWKLKKQRVKEENWVGSGSGRKGEICMALAAIQVYM
uniref:Uncharacterized protein n=1 Tax=Cucumis melo TaxID=3656 RepID=A0A9I9CH50_CUCME